LEGAGELLNRGEVELSGLFLALRRLASMEGSAAKHVLHHQHNCRKHEQYGKGSDAKVKPLVHHPYDDCDH
jgi:hypothetical protein